MNKFLVFFSILPAFCASSAYAQEAELLCNNLVTNDTTVTFSADRENGELKKGGMPKIELTRLDHQVQSGQDQVLSYRGRAGANLGAENYKVDLHFNETGAATNAEVLYRGLVIDTVTCDGSQSAN